MNNNNVIEQQHEKRISLQHDIDKEYYKSTEVSVIIPAFNEEDGIECVLEQIQAVLSSNFNSFEIIVVDDGSYDRTAKIVEYIQGIKLIKHPVNRGYGASIKTGIRNAQFNLICITDADGTYPIERIPELVSKMIPQANDMIVGARIGKNVSIPLIRRPAKWMLSQLARVVTGIEIPDLNSGLRVFDREVVARFFNLLPDGFSFTTTITLGLLVNGFNIQYIPIEYYPRLGKSKIRPIHDTLNFIQLVLKVALYFSPLKIFLPFGTFVFILGCFWGVASTFIYGRIADASTAVILMAAVQVWIVGLLADLINRRFPDYQKPVISHDQISEKE